jgi:hypothetical protein
MRGRGRWVRLGGLGLLAVACLVGGQASVATAAAPVLQQVRASGVGPTSATLSADVRPEGKATGYQFLYGTVDCAATPGACIKAPLPEGELPGSTSPTHVAVPIESLTPATPYRFLLEAHNGDGTVQSEEKTFITYAPPFGGLPDERTYEQASPEDKDAGDAVGKQAVVKASLEGDGITFGSTFGIPGGRGTGALPTYLATRGAGAWSTQGLFPSIKYGERSRLVGWSPDLSKAYTRATKLGNPRTDTLVEQSTKTGDAVVVGPPVSKAAYTYAGQSADGSIVLFEAKAKLSPKPGQPPISGAVEGGSNLYAWDRVSEEIHLAGVLNDGSAPGEGSFAGPYDWVLGTGAFNLHEGGAARSYYLADTHAIAPDGSVYFTAAGTGQLYLRRNPTQPQDCADPAMACTIHVSASRRTKADPAGEQPAAFQAASPDGSEVYFTSSQMLTDDAYTGKEQAKASIVRDTIDGNPASVEPDFIPEKAVGVTIAGSHIYWADPSRGAIGRADLNGDNQKTSFIAVPEAPLGSCEEEIKVGKSKEFVPVAVPSEPRYVAVDKDEKYVYWTNTGRRNDISDPIDGGGTIGRAKLGEGVVEDVEPAFICGEDKSEPDVRRISNPQGIAVDETHIYWANASPQSDHRSIGRALIEGGEVIGKFVLTFGRTRVPFGVALSATHVYFTTNSEGSENGALARAPLSGPIGVEEPESTIVGDDGLRGVALDSEHVYWVSQKEGTIGRAGLDLTSVENEFLKTEGIVTGLAVDSGHLLWTVNGDAPKNPGNDLYRFKALQGPTGTLTDLTPDSDPADKAGADVQGLVAASPDGSHVYLAANGNLDGGGAGGGGTCTRPLGSGKGECDLYLLDEGSSPASFVAPLRLGDGQASDSLNWVGTPVEAFNSGSYTPKSAFLAEDGETLFFQSHEQLSEYDNEGVRELYRYRPGDGIGCVSCRPTGEAPQRGPALGSINFPGLSPPIQTEGVASRNFSADGSRAFFETTEALSPEDINGAAGCQLTERFPACLDVYEWEAPGVGSCEEGGAAYSALNKGCLFLVSTGKSKFPSLFGDASQSGNDVFFFTRDGLVGQDGDELQDVYDVRVGGGLVSQNPIPPPPCESIEACHGPGSARVSEGEPATQTFAGPEDPKPKHKKAKQKRGKHHKRQRRATEKGGR